MGVDAAVRILAFQEISNNFIAILKWDIVRFDGYSHQNCQFRVFLVFYELPGIKKDEYDQVCFSQTVTYVVESFIE